MPLIPEEVRDRARRFPDRLALVVDGHGAMTFGEWDARADAVARSLVERGLEPGDRVALLLENEGALAYQTAYLATHRAGGVAVPVNPRYARREVQHVLTDSGARMIVTAGAQLERVRALRESLPGVALVVAPGAGGAGEADWDAFLAGSAAPLQVDLSEDDLADILYTSGTTGLPKGVASSHANATALDLQPNPDGGGYLHAVPLPTFMGTHGAQLVAARLAMTNIVQPRFEPARFARLVEEQRPVSVLLVPAHILLLMESGALDGADTSSVGMVMFGSAPTPPHAVEWLGRAFPAAVLMHGYGLTEAGTSVVVCAILPGEAGLRPGSVGQPLPGTELRVVGDDGSDAPAGDVGEVWLRVSSGRRSYYGDPELTADTWDREGWVHTGDLGYVDDEGYLYLVDRAKDMIVRGGYNVYCVEVESALLEHPGVAEAAAVGVPHPVLGQDVAAVIRPVEGAEAPSLEELRGFLADRLADYKLPRRLEVRRLLLPRSGMGKVDKKRLLAELAELAEPGETGPRVSPEPAPGSRRRRRPRPSPPHPGRRRP